VHAFVAATAIAEDYSLVLTGDPEDLRRLTAGAVGVVVQPLPKARVAQTRRSST
jgi:hypothetical protein